jgi:hypothetical protein
VFAWRRLALRRQVVVNLTDGSAIAGVLYRKVGSLLVIRDAVVHEPNRTPLPIDGEAIVQLNRVLFTQVAP